MVIVSLKGRNYCFLRFIANKNSEKSQFIFKLYTNLSIYTMKIVLGNINYTNENLVATFNCYSDELCFFISCFIFSY